MATQAYPAGHNGDMYFDEAQMAVSVLLISNQVLVPCQQFLNGLLLRHTCKR